MRQLFLFALIVVSFVLVASAQVVVRPELRYYFDPSVKGFPKTTNSQWIADTMALRAMLDSNGYKGSCLPFITGYCSDANTTVGDPMGYIIYRIKSIVISNQTWLKKTTHNLDALIYLYNIDIINCINFKYMTGINKYVEYLTLGSNISLASLDFEFKYLRYIVIGECKKITSFPYNISNANGLSLSNNSLTDLSGIIVSNKLINTIVYLDSNNLTTLPISFLQTLLANGDSISVVGSSLLCAPPDVMTILDKIATGGKWRTTQKPCSTSIIKTLSPIINLKGKSNNITVDLMGRLIKSSGRNISIKKVGSMYSTKIKIR